MRKSQPGLIMDKRVLALILLMFLLNIALVAFGFYYVNGHFAPDDETFLTRQIMAKDLVDYNRKLARNLGVESRSQVHEALSRFSYEIELATNVEELNKAILAYGNRTQERILQEYEAKQRETILAIINQDTHLAEINDEVRLTVRIAQDQGVLIEPADIITTETVDKITNTIAVGELVQDLAVDIEVKNGQAQLVVPLNLSDQIKALTKEIDSLRVTVHDLRVRAGFAEMTSPGIIVKIYDAEDGYTNDSIIHETDVRDTINELFAAGASGVAVGNQRLTATTAIRCVGPSILVNDERIAVNPVIIRATGDPVVLSSGLDIMRITLELSRQLRVEIEEVENLTLPAFIQR